MAAPSIVLALALGAILIFARGLRLIDTIGMLVGGAIAGAALAALAAARQKRP